MIKHKITISGCILCMMCSLNGLAAEHIQIKGKIKVKVHTNEKAAVGIGCKVEGKRLGGPGASYTCKGPKNTEYLFGYRDSLKGPDIKCGSLTLDKDSDVTLVVKDGECQIVVNQSG